MTKCQGILAILRLFVELVRPSRRILCQMAQVKHTLPICKCRFAMGTPTVFGICGAARDFRITGTAVAPSHLTNLMLTHP
jgi:hypothetical protein